MANRLYIFLLLLGVSAGAAAQVKVPLRSAPDRNQTDPAFANLRPSAQLQLPFFDDFAESDVQLNPTRWVQRGGAFLNNTYAVGQPTKNVVTFDGLRANGQPYNSGNIISPGPTDTLTSRPIDLSPYRNTDLIYLSFYWQAGGLGEAPGLQNSLIVEFRRANGSWQSPPDGVIVHSGPSSFRQAIIRVSGPDAPSGLSPYHSAFQFRFRSTGFQAGSADVWNIDYVLLGANRSASDTVHYDLAVGSRPTSLLKPYWAMPIHQYLASPANATADTVGLSVSNLYSVFRIARHKTIARNLPLGNSELLKDTSTYFPEFSRTRVRLNNLQNSVIDQTTESRRLEHEFHLVSPQVDPEPFEKRHNDTIRVRHVLDDYFAYDDGSAESAYLLLGPSGSATDQAAIRFDIPLADTLGALDVYFTPFRDYVQGSLITLKGWAVSANGAPDNDNVLFEKAVPVNYNNLNQFTRVVLDSPVPVNGQFFVGWRQSQGPGPRYIMGLDLNTNSSQYRYFGSSTNGSWLPETLLEGSIMLRPVMGGSPNPVIIAAPGAVAAATLQLYPNPGTGVFNIEGDYDALQLFDLQGRQLSLPAHLQSKTRIDLSGLPAGMYVLRAQHGSQISTHKLIITSN